MAKQNQKVNNKAWRDAGAFLTLLGSILAIGLAAWYAQADPLDNHSQQALTQTQELLTNPAQRNSYIKKHPEAQDAQRDLDNFVGDPKMEEQMYQLASQIFATVVNKGNGSVEDIKAAIDQARRNPESFAAHLTPEEQKTLQQMTRALEERQANLAPGHDSKP